MKPFIQIFLFFFIGIRYGLAQDSLILLSTKMFDDDQKIVLTQMDGWLFKEGNDPSWANKNISLTGWEKLKPSELSTTYVDKDGKVEGWFRLRFKLDTAFVNFPLGLKRGCWAATDIYLDGNLFYSFGNTGSTGSYREYNPIDKFSQPLHLRTNEEHVMAVHFVDFLSPLPPRQLKSNFAGFGYELNSLSYLIMLYGPTYNSFLLKNTKERVLYRTIWVSVASMLALLFWLLVFQNPAERKMLLLMAVYTSCSALTNLTRFFITSPDVSFTTYAINFIFFNLFTWMIFVFTFFTVVTILKFHLSTIARRVFIALFILGTGTIFFRFFQTSLYTMSILISFMYGYIIISSRKKIKGAQWAIVTGLTLSILFAVTFSLTNLGSDNSLKSNYWRLLMTSFYFSFPLSLVVYVSLRFREIIREVQENARQVVKLTKEQQEVVINQKKILEQEVTRQTAELRTTLDNLKSTQAQLIQSEKMASLGELTAGIAHEIQNPLNFVNNFSEVNKELLAEMKDEIDKGNIDEVKALANDVIENQEKINHHGKRADTIVKGMLQHSRSSSGIKEPTDINALADEYLRLAYHGLRAKDKSFNAKFETEFDPSIGEISIVAQDIGRVLLNLINNAFYAVSERKKQDGAGFEPTVLISTRKLAANSDSYRIEIRVKDNGNGIPQKVLDKIFQPFFTTKPTGQGTGLGLSLTYDIIKAHGGELKVETKEGEFAQFIIYLPS